MPRRKKPLNEPGSQEREGASVPLQHDENDIIAEVGAEHDEETGELSISEENFHKFGAVDAASIRENRRLARVVEKKRSGENRVPFNTRDPIVIYNTLLKYCTPDMIDINVKRLNGGVQNMITSRPLSGAALYEEIKAIHGQFAEADYEIKFLDAGRNEYRGTGRITMPDTRPAPQQGQPMPNYPFAMPPAATSMPAPAVQSFDPMAMMQQMFQMFRQMQASAQPPPQPQSQFVPPQQTPAMMPPMPPPSASPAEQMAWVQQAFQMFQQMQGGHQPAQIAPQPQAPTPQSNLVETMTLFQQMFDMFKQMQPAPALAPRAPYYPNRGEAPPYYPNRGETPPYTPPPQRPQTAAEQFREAMTVVRTAVDAAEEMRALVPQGGAPEAFSARDDEDSPVQVIDTGPAKIVVNKKDGSLRGVETLWSNLDKLLKFAGEQREQIQKVVTERNKKTVLPPGYVEVGPNYQPPAGYVAIPVDPRELPPPPAEVPPSITTPQRQPWEPPTIPGSE